MRVVEKSPIYRAVKLSVKRFLGWEVKPSVKKSIKLQKVGDWGFLPDQLSRYSVVYSFGVGDDIDFDVCVAERVGCSVYCFDPTIDGSLISSRSEKDGLDMHFYPWAVSGDNGKINLFQRTNSKGRYSGMYTLSGSDGCGVETLQAQAYTVRSIMSVLRHPTPSLVKFDVEGAEYVALDKMVEEGVFPKQLLVEFHHRFQKFSISDTKRIIEKLESSGYKIISVSKTGREFVFARLR